MTQSGPTVSTTAPVRTIEKSCAVWTYLRKACVCGSLDATERNRHTLTTNRLDTIHSIAITPSQGLSTLDDSIFDSVGSMSTQDTGTGFGRPCKIKMPKATYSRPCPIRPQRPLIAERAESERYLTCGGTQTPAAEMVESHTHYDGEMSPSLESPMPNWWFDRQILSLGGVCEDDEEEREVHSCHGIANNTTSNICPTPNRHPSLSSIDTKLPPSSTSINQTLPSASPRYTPVTPSLSTSSTATFVNTPISPDRLRRSTDFARYMRPFNPTQSQISNGPIEEVAECEQVELKNM